MKRIIIIALLSCAFTSVKAQLNFVLNGSFEQHRRCPFQYDLIEFANFWNGIDTSWVAEDTTVVPLCLPEYINTCGTGTCTAPSNAYFYQNPHSGNGMAQAAIYYDSSVGLGGFDYLQGKLKSYLVAGQSYCVTFYVNKEEGSAYAVNNIGAYLDDGTIDTTHSTTAQTQYTPQVLDTNLIIDTANWVKIQGSFVANGTEKFITIGLFFDTGDVRKQLFISSGNGCGLYLIDDVSVIASDAVAYAGADTSIKPGDTARIGVIANGDGMPCWWYKLGNATAIDSGGTIKVHPTTNTTYVVKMDLCGTITYDTVTVRVWPSSIDNYQLSIVNVRVYPNPATDEVTIEDAANCDVVFYDVVGREVALPQNSGTGRYLAMTDKEVLDISALNKGIYFVKITDPATGESVIVRLLSASQ